MMVRPGAFRPRELHRRIRLFALICVATLGVATEAVAQSPYFELAHASNADMTDRNLGRNFVHAGWQFSNGFMVSGGSYLAGSQHCLGSLTAGGTLPGERWQVTATAHEHGRCNIDGRRIRFSGNTGLCGTRLLTVRTVSKFGLGLCLWREADYTVGNYLVPNNPYFVKKEGPQITAHLLARFAVPRRPAADER
jgi:hypothetical protein